MRHNKYLLPVLAAALFCACALPKRKIPPPAVPDQKEAAPAKKEVVVVKLSPEDAQKVDSLYYKAVGAYSNNNMGAALKYLDEISAIHPSYQQAMELREKIRSVSGSR
ncbi:MAG: hypothetical protein NTX59_05885 [Elusimicrobia bacterium]|nr:hypothetical protein [Elusimicrobiota bacterium]